MGVLTVLCVCSRMALLVVLTVLDMSIILLTLSYDLLFRVSGLNFATCLPVVFQMYTLILKFQRMIIFR